MFYGLTFEEDVRWNEPTENNLQRARFHEGWKEAVRGQVYPNKALAKLTWRNLGYRLGKLFGETPVEEINKMYDWCVNRYNRPRSEPQPKFKVGDVVRNHSNRGRLLYIIEEVHGTGQSGDPYRYHAHNLRQDGEVGKTLEVFSDSSFIEKAT